MVSFNKYLQLTRQLNNGFGGISLFRHFKIYKEWQSQVKSKKYPLSFELPWITIAAKDYIEAYLKRVNKGSVKVFEYGSGGSSLFFLKFATEVVSAEHDEGWFDLVKKTIEEKGIQGWRGFLLKPQLLVESESVSNLDASNPNHYYTSDENFFCHSFKNYVSAIDSFPDNYFDIVLIDGRSRPSCIKHSIDKVRKDGLLILDNAEREYYFSHPLIESNDFELVFNLNGALICNEHFTQTNIYIKK